MSLARYFLTRPRARRALAVEQLEDRTAPAVFLVTTTADNDLGSLRQAIVDANTAAGVDTIQFAIPATDPNFVDVDAALPGGDADADAWVIRPLSALPALNDATGGTTLDGRTQTAFGGDTNPFGPEVVLDGSLAGASARGLVVTSNGNAILGLNVQRFGSIDIEIRGGDQNWIAGNVIGLNATGTAVAANGARGVELMAGSQFNVIGTNSDGDSDLSERNVISGNLGSGVLIQGSGSMGNVVAGNFLGTDMTGSIGLGGGNGVFIFGGATNNRVGGSDAQSGNLISGSKANGIFLAGATGTVIQGNRIGTDVTGTFRIENAARGIEVANTPGFLIGGTAPGAGNLISGNRHEGVIIYGPSTTSGLIQGNRIGTSAAGTAAVGNGAEGVQVHNGATNVQIGGSAPGAGNLISGNGSHGVFIASTGTANNVVAGNFIGTNAAGTVALGNGGNGVVIQSGAMNNTAGGNLISGNLGSGVRIQDAGSTGNVIAGNRIGTNAAGTAAVPNANGVTIENAPGNLLGTNADGIDDALERNVISGNVPNGVLIRGIGSTGNVVAGNYIGTNAAGSAAVPNTDHGVFITESASDNTIGGATSAAGNVISGNRNMGVRLRGSSLHATPASGNRVWNNRIGTDAAGTAPLGNGDDGVSIASLSDFAVSGNLIGGPGVGNVIAFNGGRGVAVEGAAATGNAIRGNAIHSNGGLGIDLVNGGNNSQAAPVITAAVPGAGTAVAGTLTGPANATVLVDFYASAAADPFGFGEGERYLGSVAVTTDAAGLGSFSVLLAAATVAGEVVTATATDSIGNTSEFSAAVAAQASTQVLTASVTNLVTSGTINQGQGNSMMQQLDQAQKLVDRGNPHAAVNVLRAQRNHINSLVTEGVLTPQEAAPLLAMLDLLIDDLGG